MGWYFVWSALHKCNDVHSSLCPTVPPQKSVSSSAADQGETHCAAGFDRSESSPAAVTVPLNKAPTQHDASTQVYPHDHHPPSSQQSLDDRQGTSSTDYDSDDQHAYGCDCDEKCSITDIVSGKCPSPKSTTGLFPSLRTKNLSESDKNLLSGHLYTEFCQISRKYASLTSFIRKSLKQREVTPAQLTDKLMDLNGLIHLPEGTKHPLLEDRLLEIKSASTIDEIFIVLKEYSSFFNHEIIEYIVEELGTDEDKTKLEEYKENFMEYCQRQVFECPFYSRSKKSSRFIDLVMKVDSESVRKRYTMKALQVFCTQVAKLLQVTKHTLHLYSVEEGCLQVTFQIPRFLKTMVFPLNDKQRKLLKDLGVVRIDSDGLSQPLTEPEAVSNTKLIIMLLYTCLLPYRKVSHLCKVILILNKEVGLSQTLSLSHHINESDIVYALSISYLESAILETSVVMAIQEFHLPLS